MKFKRLILFVPLLIGTIGCGKEEVIYVDVPQYTADQVIVVASAYSPAFTRLEQLKYICNEEPAWSTQYMGDRIWLVTKYAILKLTEHRELIEQWHFHESSGSLKRIE